jgi:hypothetical protein
MRLHLTPKNVLPLVAALGSASVSMLHADILANDPFATGADPSTGQYTSGVSVGGQNPTIPGFTGGWNVQNNGNTGGAGNVVSATSLSYSSSGYVTSGGSVTQVSDNGRYTRLFGANPFATDNTTIYMSFLMQSSSNSGYAAVELNNSNWDDNTRSFQLGISSFGDFGGTSNYAFRVNNSGSLVGDFGSFDTSAHLFVVKFVLSNAALGDSVTAWMDPTLGGGDPSGGITLSGFDLSTTELLSLATFAGPQTGYDEIRLGTTFQDVTLTSVPEPRSTALLLCGVCVFAGVARGVRRRLHSA